MRIGITMDSDKGLKGDVAQHLGQCAYYLIVEIEKGKVISDKVYKNDAMHGGGGCQAVDGLVKHNITHAISGGMGGNAQAKFAAAGIKVFGFSGNVKDAIDAFNNEALGALSSCAGHEHGHESGGCSSHN